MFNGVFSQLNYWSHFWCHFFEAAGDAAILRNGFTFDFGTDRIPASDLWNWNLKNLTVLNQNQPK